MVPLSGVNAYNAAFPRANASLMLLIKTLVKPYTFYTNIVSINAHTHYICDFMMIYFDEVAYKSKSYNNS